MRRTHHLRSSPRKRGPRATEPGSWIPACAGMNGMERRAFISLLAGVAGWPLAARAQGSDRVRRIGVLTILAENDPEAKVWLAAFQDGLQQLGWTEGRNISIDYRWAGDDRDQLRSYAAELVRLAPDVLFASTTPALAALHRETRSLPIVFVQVSDPVKLGFVANLARPGGNITGFTTVEHAIGGKWLELIRDTAPGLSRVAVIFELDNPSQPAYLQAIEAAAPAFGVELIRAGARNAADIERAIDAFARSKGALMVVPSAVGISHRDLIIALAARHRLPAVYPYRVFARSGGFISYGVDLTDPYRRAAGYVDRILKGTKPGDLPVQLATKFELVVNLKTAKALGLTIAEPFLQHADEVIE
jgi:putative tryptophan/tyrosine transport system substrate-binding protein